MDGWGCSGLGRHWSCRTGCEVYRWGRDSGLGSVLRAGSGSCGLGRSPSGPGQLRTERVLALAEQALRLVQHLAGREFPGNHLVCLVDQFRDYHVGDPGE